MVLLRRKISGSVHTAIHILLFLAAIMFGAYLHAGLITWAALLCSCALLIVGNVYFQYRRKNISLAGTSISITLAAIALFFAGAMIWRLWTDPNLLLTMAASEGYDRILAWSARHGGDVNGFPRTGYKRLPLDGAVNAGRLSTVELLLRLGADSNGHTSYGEPLVLLAAADGEEEILRALWQHGANLNAKSPRSMNAETALHSALRDHQWATTRFLVEHGADLNVQDGSGETALMMATCNASPEATKLIDLLLGKGADRMIKDTDGRTALDFARTCNDEKASEILSH